MDTVLSLSSLPFLRFIKSPEKINNYKQKFNSGNGIGFLRKFDGLRKKC